MKLFNVKSLAFAFVAAMGIAGSANAAISVLTVQANGASVEEATATATKLLTIECNFLYGYLVGEPKVVSVDGYTVVLSGECSH